MEQDYAKKWQSQPLDFPQTVRRNVEATRARLLELKGCFMPQDRETGARASRFGHQNGTFVIRQLGGTNRKPGSNECDLNGERVSVHSAHYRGGLPQSVGVTLVSLRAIKSVVGAFEDEDGSFRVLKLAASKFRRFSRPTASLGPSYGRVVLGTRSVFEEYGNAIALIPAQDNRGQ